MQLLKATQETPEEYTPWLLEQLGLLGDSLPVPPQAELPVEAGMQS